MAVAQGEQGGVVSERKRSGTVVFILLVTTLLVLLTNIPLIYGYLSQRPGLRFMGIVAGLRDNNFYFMLMAQGDGWTPILRNYFATGESDAIYHGFFWFVLGKIGNVLHVNHLATYHGARIVITILFAIAIYWLISRFLKSNIERIATLVMVSFGAGAGWIMMVCNELWGVLYFVPSDIGNPEASSFFTLMTFPHLSTSLILIALCFGLVEAAVTERKIGLAIAGGVCGMVLGFIHVVNLIVIYAGLALFALASLIILRWSRPLRSVIIFGAISVWPIAYYLYLMLVEPALLPQVPVRSPRPLAYLVGFAPFIILSVIHVASLFKKRSLPRGDLFLICWAVANSLLLYSYPLLTQESRTVLGLQLPLAILSSRAIFGTIVPWFEPKREASIWLWRRTLSTTVAVLIIAFTFPSSFYNIFEWTGRLKNYPELFSLTSDNYEALRFLKEVRNGDIVISGDWIGNYVPRLAHKRSWLGQYDLPSHDSRLDAANKFYFAAEPASSRYDFLKNNNVDFVYYGQDEREGGAFEPEGMPFLERIFRNNSVSIYRYMPGGRSNEEESFQ